MPLKIAIFTNAFPFEPGEQFLEEEIRYWAVVKNIRLTLFPAKARGKARPVPSDISVNLALTKANTPSFLVFGLVLLPCKSFFWQELKILYQKKKLSLKTLAVTILNGAKVVTNSMAMKSMLHQHGPFDVAYTYWHQNQAYACTLNRGATGFRRVVSRIHGYDLYEELRPGNHMPFKLQFIHLLDQVFALSTQANDYLRRTYDYDKAVISPLGVKIPDAMTSCTGEGSFKIVSISLCLEVKRIDKIIMAMEQVATSNPQTQFTWVHIGSGALRSPLESLASRLLATIGNLTFEFRGQLSNRQVLETLGREQFDCIVNTSNSEGIPVSLMEAMSYGIPAIAPDVGGIKNLRIDSKLLLPDKPSVATIAATIKYAISYCKQHSVRSTAKRVIEDSFNASTNYKSFIQQLISLVDEN